MHTKQTEKNEFAQTLFNLLRLSKCFDFPIGVDCSQGLFMITLWGSVFLKIGQTIEEGLTFAAVQCISLIYYRQIISSYY